MPTPYKYLLVILGIPLAGAAVFCLYSIFDCPFDNRVFEKDVWLNNSNLTDSDNPRGEMYDSLVKNYLKLEMSKKSIIEMLGKPDFKETENLLSYNLGMWSGFRMDYDSLDLYFSNKDKLIGFQKLQH